MVEIKNQIYDSSLSLVKSGRGLKGGQGGPVPSAKEKKKEKNNWAPLAQRKKKNIFLMVIYIYIYCQPHFSKNLDPIGPSLLISLSQLAISQLKNLTKTIFFLT